jgi:hypothetical protein
MSSNARRNHQVTHTHTHILRFLDVGDVWRHHVSLLLYPSTVRPIHCLRSPLPIQCPPSTSHSATATCISSIHLNLCLPVFLFPRNIHFSTYLDHPLAVIVLGTSVPLTGLLLYNPKANLNPHFVCNCEMKIIYFLDILLDRSKNPIFTANSFSSTTPSRTIRSEFRKNSDG